MLYRIIPIKLYSSKRQDISHLRVFGCTTYLLLQNQPKLALKAYRIILVGYDDQSKRYKCFDCDKRKIIISRDIKFQDDEVGVPGKQQQLEDNFFKTFIDSNSRSLLPREKRIEESPPNLEETCNLPDIDLAPTSKDIPSIIFKPFFEVNTNLELQSSEPLLFPIQRSSRFRCQNLRLDDYILFVDLEDFDSCHATLASSIEEDKVRV